MSDKIFPTAQDAENAFYEALESRDLDGMMAVWAEDEEILCVHPLGARLKAAALTTKTPWLMFLRAGCVPEPGWIQAADHFMETIDRLDVPMRAAVFRPPGAGD